MEIDDVSNVQSWMELLNRQKAVLQAASKRKSEDPSNRKPLRQLVHEFMSSYTSTKEMMASRNQHLIHQSFVPPPYQPSIAPLVELEKVPLKDLRLETHHRGSYVLLRTATPGLMMTAVMVVMEDENGSGVVFQLYQQRDDEYRTAEQVLPQKTVWIVKEPYFKVMNDGGYGIRVDHISDLVQLSDGDERIPEIWRPRISELEQGAIALKDDGNNALKAGKMYEAVSRYTKGLNQAQEAEQRRLIQLNRSLANLRLGAYDQALEDAGYSRNASDNSEKGFYRAARSLYELGRFDESNDTYSSLLARFPHSAEAPKELTRTKSRLREAKHGDYNFEAMYEAAEKTPPNIDCATYLGPIAVKASEGRDRGFFTTKDVVAGELLLCEKAFAYCWAETGGSTAGSKSSLLINTSTNRMTMGTQASLITDVVQKIRRVPSVMPDVTSLFCGGYQAVQEAQVDGLPVIDTFLIERIICLNCFGCPRTSSKSHSEKAGKSKDETKGNAFHTSGLFINASYINHSCYSNVRRSFIGDMMIVRATRNIPADTEITFWYSAPEPKSSYTRTQEKLSNWGFQCACSICKDKKATRKQTVTKRNGLLRDLKDAIGARGGLDLAKAERLLAALEKTYSVPASEVPRLALWDPYLLLTRACSANQEPEKVIQTAWKVLASLGFIIVRKNPSSSRSPFHVEQWGLMEDYVVEAWVHLWVAYAQLAPELCEKAQSCARIAYKICVGEDWTFDRVYGGMAQKAIAKEKDPVESLQELSI
ncbi:MAG: hypothetical protein Q9191_005988 [Dirinaria sp. TL-2023a]